MILRHIERRPLKSLLTVLGIACACGLMMVGNYQKGAIDFMVDVQFRQGAREDEFFVIIDGSVTVRLSSRKRLRLGPGDFFGEMSLLDGEPRSATVKAETDLRLLVINRRHFWELLREVPELTQRMLVTLSRRVRELEKGRNA